MSRIVLKLTVLSGTVLVLWSGLAHSRPLEKRSRIELRLGFWGQGEERRETTQAGQYGVETTAKSGDVLIALSYGRWLQENLSLNLTLSALAGEASSRVGSLGVSTHSVSVLSVLLGVRYYLPESTFKTPFRPYLAASVGPYIGAEAKNEVGSQIISESQTLGSFGGNLGAGLDVEFGQHFMAGVNVGYNLMMDFSESIGGRDNYSGPECSIGISYLLGRGVQP